MLVLCNPKTTNEQMLADLKMSILVVSPELLIECCNIHPSAFAKNTFVVDRVPKTHRNAYPVQPRVVFHVVKSG